MKLIGNSFLALLISFLCIKSFAQESLKVESRSENTALRLVVLAPNLVEILFELGLGEHIVAASEYSNFPEQAKKISTVGNYLTVDIEKVLSLRPTHVVVWQGGTPEKHIERMRELQVNLVLFKANSPQQLISEIARMGKIFGVDSNARAITQQLSKQLQLVQSRYEKAPKLTGFIEVWANPLTSAGRSTIIDEALKVCGVTNIIKEQATYPQVDLEWLILQDFDVIVQPNSVSKPTEVFDWQRFPNLPAVQSKAIVNVDADLLLRWTPRWFVGLEELCIKIDSVGR